MLKFIQKVVQLLKEPKVVSLTPEDYNDVYVIKDTEDDRPVTSPFCRPVPPENPFISEREALQLSIAVIEPDMIDQAQIGLTLLVLVHNPSAGLSVEHLLEASVIVDMMPDVLIPKAQELVNGLLRAAKPFRAVAFSQSTEDEKKRGDFLSAHRRSCFQVEDVSAARRALGESVQMHYMRPVGQTA